MRRRQRYPHVLIVLLGLAAMGQGAGGAGASGGAGFPLLIPLLLLLALPLWCFAIVDITKRDFPDSSTKLIWALVIFLVPILGTIMYLAIGRKQGQRRPTPASPRKIVLGFSIPDFLLSFVVPCLVACIAVFSGSGSWVLAALLVMSIRIVVHILYHAARRTREVSRSATTRHPTTRR
jgi:hypothetical protein